MTRNVEIVAIGNEILIGKTVNTNAHWLAKRVTSVGLNTNRITVIGDDIEEIKRFLIEAIDRRPLFLLITGGLGPTFDDKTLAGISQAVGLSLNVDPRALKMVKDKYRHYAEKMGRDKIELTPARIKMATIPEGAEPIPNPVGTAPAVLIKKNNVTIISLPGVPLEMKAIFENTVFSLLKSATPDQTFFETSLLLSGIMESEMAPIIDQVMRDNPYVYIKSHPMGTEQTPNIELHLSTMANQGETAKKRISRAMIQLSEAARSKGGTAHAQPRKTPEKE